MTREETVIRIIAAQAGLDSYDTILKSENLRDDLKLDSLDLIELLIELEHEFKISVPDKDFEEVTDVQSVIDAVEKVINNQTE